MRLSDRNICQAFIRLADTLAADFDVTDFLHTLTEDGVDLLGVSASRILLAGHNSALNVVAASTEQARLPELTRLKALEGPCVDAYRTRAPVSCPDLSAQTGRWPAFGAAALSAGFTAVHAMPMLLRGRAIGAMSLYSSEPHGIGDDAADLGQALADMATIGIMHARVRSQLQAALDSRVAIEQAKGVLAERLGVTADEAFGLIRAYARDHNLKLTETARSVIDGDLRLGASPDGLDAARSTITSRRNAGRATPRRRECRRGLSWSA